MALDDDALLKMVTDSEGFKQIDAVGDRRVADVVLAVTAAHAGDTSTQVEEALRARFAEAGVPVPVADLATMVRAIAEAKPAR